MVCDMSPNLFPGTAFSIALSKHSLVVCISFAAGIKILPTPTVNAASPYQPLYKTPKSIVNISPSSNGSSFGNP